MVDVLDPYLTRLLAEYCGLHNHGINSSRKESKCDFSCRASSTDLLQT